MNSEITEKKFKLSKKTKQGLIGYLFASPWILGFLAFTLFPLAMSLFYSFTNYNRVDDPTFNNFGNYIFLLFDDILFLKTMGNTLFHVVFGTIFSLVIGILVSLILNKPIKGLGIWRTIFYLPNVVSAVAMALLWGWMFNKDYGLINEFLGFFGIGPINWLGDSAIIKISLILMGAWGAGVSALFFLGALKGIPKELYEAASIAGTSKFNQFFKITLPLITPTILFMLITTVIGNFQYWTMAYIMTGPGPDNSAYYYSYYLYDKAFTDFQMGYASAMSWVMFIIVAASVLLILKTSKYWVFYMGEDA